MDWEEKYLDSLNKTNTSFATLVLTYLFLVVYLGQRTIKFINNEIEYFSEQQQVQQMEQGLTFFKLSFSYETMNVVWVWTLALILCLLCSLLIKRKLLCQKMSTSYNMTFEDISLLVHFDLLSGAISRFINPIFLISFLASLIVIILQITHLIDFLLHIGEELASMLVLAGSLTALAVLFIFSYLFLYRN